MDSYRKSDGDTKLVARHAIATFGSPPSIWRFTREGDELPIDIGGSVDRPSVGLVSYTTIGLSDQPSAQCLGARPQGWELAGVCAAKWLLFPQILAAAAFAILKQQRPPQRGHILCDFIGRYYPRSTVPHLYFAAPLLWSDRLSSLECKHRSVHWLLAVPVASAELAVLEKEGDAGLGTIYQEREVNMFDLARGHWAW